MILEKFCGGSERAHAPAYQNLYSPRRRPVPSLVSRHAAPTSPTCATGRYGILLVVSSSTSICTQHAFHG